MQPVIALTNPQLFDMNNITFISVERKYVREKLQREFRMLMRLRMALLLSVFKSTDDELLDDPRVEKRLNELLDSVRFHSPSLNFHHRFTRRGTEVIPGVWLKVNYACTEASLYRDHGDNVVFMDVQHG